MFLFGFRSAYKITIHNLDGTSLCITEKARNYGGKLFDRFCDMINLSDKDYFGLLYVTPRGFIAWLDMRKSLRRQLWRIGKKELYFRVKFYIEDPSTIVNLHTRHLFALQVGIDIREGFVSGSETDYSIMISYLLQSAFGDFGHGFGDSVLYEYLNLHEKPIVKKILCLYRKNQGISPTEANTKLLNMAKNLESYGKRLFPCQVSNSTNTVLHICYDCKGIHIYHMARQHKYYPWADVVMIVFAGNRLRIKFCCLNRGEILQDEYLFRNSSECRAYWKIIYEQMSFYKDLNGKREGRIGKTNFIRRGSSFRYSGRTLSEMNRSQNNPSSVYSNFERRYVIHGPCQKYFSSSFHSTNTRLGDCRLKENTVSKVFPDSSSHDNTARIND